jgi:hypothetical protein
LGQRADLLHLNLVQTGHVSDVVDAVHSGILLGIVVNFRHKQIGVAQCLYLVHNVFLRQQRNPMKHHKYHQHYQVKAAKLHARAEAALDLITALVIGIGLAACLFYGLSA